MTVLGEIRVRGAFREPQFADLALGHVPFDNLSGDAVVEGPLLEAVRSGSNAAVVGARGGGKSSVLAWLCRSLPHDHIPIRVPVVGMDDPSDPSVLGSVALGAALEAARGDAVSLDVAEKAEVENARADERTTRPGGGKVGGKLGGGPIPAELSAELTSLEKEYTRGTQPIDRLHGFDRLLSLFTHHKLIPVFVLEDTEAALGAGVDDASRDRFFTSSLKLLVREVDAPTVIAVQTRYVALVAYAELRPLLFETQLPVLGDRAAAALHAILARRLEVFGIEASLDEVIAPGTIDALAEFYAEKDGSIRHVLAALDVAAATAVDNDDARLELGHVRLGIEDWRDR